MRITNLFAGPQSGDLPDEVLRDLERHAEVEEVPWDGRAWDFDEDG